MTNEHTIDIDIRGFDADYEVRENDDGLLSVKGYAAVWDKRSKPIFGMFVEEIAPNAFEKSLRSIDVMAYLNHDVSRMLGSSRVKSGEGMLELTEDSKGLHFDLNIMNTATGQEVYRNIEKRVLRDVSFRFRAIVDQWTETAVGKPDIRRVVEAELYDISPTPEPAYPQTSVSLRVYEEWRANMGDDNPVSLVEIDQAIRERELILRRGR